MMMILVEAASLAASFFATVRIGGTDWPDDKHQRGSTGRSATNKLS